MAYLLFHRALLNVSDKVPGGKGEYDRCQEQEYIHTHFRVSDNLCLLSTELQSWVNIVCSTGVGDRLPTGFGFIRFTFVLQV